MAGWNGSGVFVRLYNWVTDQTNGIKILASRMDGEFDNYKAGLENCVTRDGQNVPLANLPMGGFKHTGLGDGSADTDSVTYRQFKNGFNFLQTAGIDRTADDADAQFTLNGKATYARSILFKAASVLRWVLSHKVDNNLVLNRYNSSGVLVDTPINVDQSTGIVSLNGKFRQSGSATVAGGAGIATVTLPVPYTSAYTYNIVVTGIGANARFAVVGSVDSGSQFRVLVDYPDPISHAVTAAPDGTSIFFITEGY